MLTRKLMIIGWFALIMALAAANWIDAAEPIIVFQSNRDGDDEIFTAMDDGTIKQLTRNKAQDIEPAWSPDGNQIVWFTQRQDLGAETFNMMIMDADGKNEANLTPDINISLTSQPTFSPDGTLIAFSSRGALPNGINNNVAIIKFAEGVKRQEWELYNLTVWGAQLADPLNVQDRFQVWSPDGTQIAWQTRRAGNFDIWVTDVVNDIDKQKDVQKNLTKDSKKDDVHPRFSPDGTKILFESKRDGDWEIFVMDSRTGENIVQLTNDEKNDKNAEWSRKGAKIAFESKRDGNSEIYVMDADGANPVNISNNPTGDTRPQWRGLGPGAFRSKFFAVEPLAKRLTTLGRIKKAALLQNYPNPFNPETWMPYILSEDSPVTISIYDPTGQLVRTLSLGIKPKGAYLFRTQAAYWDGSNDAGEAVVSGLYFYELRAGDFTTMRKMVVAK
jgi:Tol biopolymer transport system component